MVGRYQAYSEYKDAGVAGIGKIPKHWSFKKLKWEFSARSGTDRKSGNGKYRLYGANGPIGNSNTISVIRNTGTVVVGRVGSAGSVTYVKEVSGVSDNALIINNYYLDVPRFDYYLFQIIDFGELVSKNAQPLITASIIKNCKVAVPYERSERTTIANFLDHETAKIDTLIEKQELLIKLLKEKRQAVISHAVTKGLNDDASMRNSGVEWLGEVPEHWDVKRIYSLFAECHVRASSDIELQYPFLSISIHYGISDKELDEKELDRKFTRSEDRSLYKIVHKNDLAYNMMRAWQGGFGASQLSGLVSPAYVVCNPKTSLDSYYFELVLRTANAVTELKRYSRGITDFRLRLYWDEFKNICVPVPPATEIDEILVSITDLNSKYSNLVSASERQIELLKERRKALISAAVTGKIDVRNWQPPPTEIPMEANA